MLRVAVALVVGEDLFCELVGSELRPSVCVETKVGIKHGDKTYSDGGLGHDFDDIQAIALWFSCQYHPNHHRLSPGRPTCEESPEPASLPQRHDGIANRPVRVPKSRDDAAPLNGIDGHGGGGLRVDEKVDL